MIDQDKTHNVAGRLLALLERLPKKEKVSVKTSKNKTQQQVVTNVQAWCMAFGCDPDPLRYYVGFDEVIRGLEQLESYGLSKEPPNSRWVKPISALKRMLRPHPPDQGHSPALYDDETVRMMLDHWYHVMPPESPIPKDTLADLLTQVDVLFSQVRSTAIDRALQEWLLRALYDIQTAILLYSTTGAMVLKQKFCSFMGQIKPRIDEVDVAAPSTGKAIREFAGSLADAIQIGTAVPQLLEAVRHFLGP